MTDHETSEEQEPKRCSTCKRILTLGDKPDRCTMCLADDWARKHHSRYIVRHLVPNRKMRRTLARQLKDERTRAL